MSVKTTKLGEIDGLRYFLVTLSDATGTRWWINCFADFTPYHAMGASPSHHEEATPEALAQARREALDSFENRSKRAS